MFKFTDRPPRREFGVSEVLTFSHLMTVPDLQPACTFAWNQAEASLSTQRGMASLLMGIRASRLIPTYRSTSYKLTAQYTGIRLFVEEMQVQSPGKE